MLRFHIEWALNARNALGSIYSGAISPDGTINQNLFQQGLRNDPSILGFMPEAASQGATLQDQQQQNQTHS